MAKKFLKRKSLRAKRRRDFLENLDLEVEEGEETEVDGRRELAQPPRRVENAIDDGDGEIGGIKRGEFSWWVGLFVSDQLLRRGDRK